MCAGRSHSARNSGARGLERMLGLPTGLRRALPVTHIYERKHKSGSFVETRLTASQGGLTGTHRVSSQPAGRTRHVPAPHVPPSGAALCLRAPRETDSAFCLRPLRTEMQTAFLRPWQGVQCHKPTELGSEKEPRGSTSPVHSQTNKARPG